MKTASFPGSFVGRLACLFLLSPLMASLGCSDSTSGDEPKDGGATMDNRMPSDGGPSDTSLEDGPADTASPQDGLRDDQAIPEDSGSDAPSVDGADIRVDGALPDGDGSICTVVPVWNTNSGSFTLSITPTMIMKPPPGAECGGSSVDYTFDFTRRTLVQKGCVSFRPVDRIASLDSAATNAIVTVLQGVRSTCSPDCRTWIPKDTLAVRDTAGCAQGSWEDDHCNLNAMPPYVPAADMLNLRALLDDILTATCEPDGASSDAGLCKPTLEGGTDGCNGFAPNADADAPDGAAPDAAFADASDSDGAVCTAHPVGSDFAALSLVMTTSNDAGCPNANLSFNVSLKDKVLTQFDCANGSYINRRVDLVPSQIETILGRLAALRTSCVWHCGPGGIDIGLGLHDCRGESRGFVGDTYINCDQPPTRPFIDTNALVSLDQLLRSIVAESCGLAGDATSPGMCTPRCRQSVRL
jgi:hypothetical protein